MEYLPFIALGAILCIATVFVLFGARRDRTRCEICGGPRDPNTHVPGASKYGVLACDECGRTLETRYGGDWPPWPPGPPHL